MIFKNGNPKFHHIGIAVPSLKETETDRALIVNDPTQGVNVVFTDLCGCQVEFIEPARKNSPISRGLEENRKLVHLCFEVDNLELVITEAKTLGFIIVHESVPAVAFGGRRIAWLYSQILGLVELLER